MFAIAFTPKVTRSDCALSIPRPVRAGALVLGLLLGVWSLYAFVGKGPTLPIKPPLLRYQVVAVSAAASPSAWKSYDTIGAGGGTTIDIIPPTVRQYGAADSTIVVSPNPASEYMTAAPGADVIISRFHILNSSGSPIFSMNVSGAETVDLNLQVGNYYFLFETSLGMINKPVVIQ